MLTGWSGEPLEEALPQAWGSYEALPVGGGGGENSSTAAVTHTHKNVQILRHVVSGHERAVPARACKCNFEVTV